MRPTDDQINEIINRLVDNPGPRWSGMTFEDGVRAALDWVLGDEPDDPLTDN